MLQINPDLSNFSQRLNTDSTAECGVQDLACHCGAGSGSEMCARHCVQRAVATVVLPPRLLDVQL